MGHHAAAGSGADFDEGVAGSGDLFEIPVEELAVEGFCGGKVGGVELDVTERIGHDFSLLEFGLGQRRTSNSKDKSKCGGSSLRSE